MYKLILKILLFFIVIIAIITIELLIVSKILSKKMLIVEKKRNVLVLGDSNTRNAVNDSILFNYSNYSLDGASNLYSYLKLKEIIQKNKSLKLDTVFLSFAPHQVFKEIETIRLFSLINMKHNCIYYYYLMGIEEYKTFFVNKKDTILYTIPRLVKYGSQIIIRSALQNLDMTQYGHYYSPHRSDILNKIEELKKIPERNNFEYAMVELEYMIKIAEFCKKKNIKLILLNTPKHKIRFERFRNETIKFYDFYNKYLKDVEFWDFSNFDMPDSGFYDTMHLNSNGAKIFSEYLLTSKKEIHDKYIYSPVCQTNSEVVY